MDFRNSYSGFSQECCTFGKLCKYLFMRDFERCIYFFHLFLNFGFFLFRHNNGIKQFNYFAFCHIFPLLFQCFVLYIFFTLSARLGMLFKCSSKQFSYVVFKLQLIFLHECNNFLFFS
jgi:hypothetical protein